MLLLIDYIFSVFLDSCSRYELGFKMFPFISGLSQRSGMAQHKFGLYGSVTFPDLIDCHMK